MKKKILILFAVLALMLVMVPTVFAAEVVDSGSFDEITWVLTNDGTLNVSGNGKVESSYYDDWSSYNAQIKQIIINEGITSYNADEFLLVNLESVFIPSTLAKIGYNTFGHGEKLKEITVHPNNKHFHYDGHGLLFDYEQTEILYVAGAYEGECYIPASMVSTSNIYDFSYSKTITGIHVDPNNPAFYSDENGILYDKEQTILYYCPRFFQGTYTVPDTVTEIYNRAFEGCTRLDAIILTSSNGIHLDTSAFEGCTGLTSVSIPSKSRTSTSAFGNCTNLKTVYFNGVVDFMASCFSGCINLEYIVFDDSIQNMNSANGYTFWNCPKLKTIILPNAVNIGYLAFAGSSIENIYFIGNAPAIGSLAFGREQNGNDTRITVNAYYPMNDESWNDVISAEYEGFVTWIPYDPKTDYPCYHMDSKLNNATTATCTTPGYTGNTVCTDCGEVLESGTEIPKLPHTEVTDKAVAATCTAPGKTEGKHCSVCKTVLVRQETVPATGHTFGQWTQITPPTHTSEGLEQRKCHCGETEQRSIAKLPSDPKLTFTDVASGSFYEKPVAWAVANGITNGRTATTFAPDDFCKRSEVVTFLWRTQGEPVPGSTQTGFTDVEQGVFYTDPVAWALENSITNGMGDGTFGVNRSCTRSQVVTFLWRTAGCPKPASAEHPFTDLEEGAFYYDAVLWAVEKGITNGMTPTTFGPDSTCTRGQIVTFLHRFAG